MASELTEAQFRALFPKAVIGTLPFLNKAMFKYDITSPVRAAAFLAQVGHESAGFTRFEEALGYSASRLIAVWPSRFNASNAKDYAYNPERLANKVYADRMGNGDEESGDGWLFHGRGPIQLTGRGMYAKAAKALGYPLVQKPYLLLDVDIGCLAAAWFWKDNGCNELADAGKFEAVTRKINGGVNGLDDRMSRWEKAKAVLNG